MCAKDEIDLVNVKEYCLFWRSVFIITFEDIQIMNRRTGCYFGYFTARIREGGRVYFVFKTQNHPSLKQKRRIKAIVVRNQTPRYFEMHIEVKSDKESQIRLLIKQKTLVAIQLKKGEFKEIYDLVPRNIND